MRDMKAIVIPLVVALGVCIMITGCGPTPEPEPTPTPVVVVVTATPVPPTATPVPPTATPVPPTPPPTPTEEVVRSYEQYVSDEMGFSLTYPEEWIVVEGDTLAEGVTLGPPDRPFVFLWIGFWQSDLSADETNQKAIQIQKEFNEEQGYENLVHGDISEETRFGLSVLHLGYEYDNKEGEHIAGGIYAWTTDARDSYTVVMELPAADEVAYEDTNLIWKSIELTTPTAARPIPTPVPTEPPPTDTPVPPTATPVPTSPPPPPPPPTTSPAAEHTQKGFDYLDQEKWDEALAEFQEAIRLDPGFAYAYAGLGYSYIYKGEFAKAIEPLEKYLQLMPDASDRADVEALIQKLRNALAAQPPPGGPCCQPLQAGKGAIWFENHVGETVQADVGPNFYEIPGKQGDVAGCLCPQLDPGHYTFILKTGWGDARGDVDIVAGQTIHFPVR